MALSLFNIDNFRNLCPTQLEFGNKYNIFYGENGSGKTSILEAIYYLVLGRSFRTHILKRIIKHGANDFSIFGKIKQDNKFVSVGLTKSTETGKRIRIDGKDLSSNLELTKLLPMQLLNHDSYMFLYDGPKIRRQFMDWGLFHVEQSFLGLWRKVERILEQRNTALRAKFSIDQITIWDKELAQFGYELHNYRKHYIEQLTPVLQTILEQLSVNFPINISYYAGWDTTVDLETALASNFKHDMQFGYTTSGPHRADLKVMINGVPAKDSLSRGQQKFLLYGLQIAQGALLNQLTNKHCIYLADDLAAELDAQKYKLLTQTLLNLDNSQIFITGLPRHDRENMFAVDHDRKIFQVTEGAIKPS